MARRTFKASKFPRETPAPPATPEVKTPEPPSPVPYAKSLIEPLISEISDPNIRREADRAFATLFYALEKSL